MKTRSQSQGISLPTGSRNKAVKRLKDGTGTGKVAPKKAPKFSWVVEGLLAAHGRPAQHGHVEYLCHHGISVLVTLTENKPRALREYPGEDLEWKHIPVKDEKPPSVDQAQEFVSIVDEAQHEGKKVSVHCAWGRGRTGTLLACYLAKREKLSAEDAIIRVRQLRPGSIDTKQQEDTVHQFVKTLKM